MGDGAELQKVSEDAAVRTGDHQELSALRRIDQFREGGILDEGDLETDIRVAGPDLCFGTLEDRRRGVPDRLPGVVDGGQRRRTGGRGPPTRARASESPHAVRSPPQRTRPWLPPDHRHHRSRGSPGPGRPPRIGARPQRDWRSGSEAQRNGPVDEVPGQWRLIGADHQGSVDELASTGRWVGFP